MWATTWLQLVFAFTFIPFFQSHHVHFRGGAEIGRNWMELASAPNGIPILLQNVPLNTNCIAKKLQKHKKIKKKNKKNQATFAMPAEMHKNVPKGEAGIGWNFCFQVCQPIPADSSLTFKKNRLRSEY